MAAAKRSQSEAGVSVRVLALLRASSGCRHTSVLQTAAMLNVSPSEALRVHAMLTAKPGR